MAKLHIVSRAGKNTPDILNTVFNVVANTRMTQKEYDAIPTEDPVYFTILGEPDLLKKVSEKLKQYSTMTVMGLEPTNQKL